MTASRPVAPALARPATIGFADDRVLLATTALTAPALLVAAGLLMAPGAARANPDGADVKAGDVSIQENGNRLDVHQGSQKAIIDWQSFSIGQGEVTQFHMPGGDSVVLNRVTGDSVSEIFGSLIANGQVMLINPNGILFGAGSRVDVSALVASTADIADEDFLNGHYAFLMPSDRPGASVINEGDISIAERGYGALVGEHVANHGTITARLGQVALASGKAFTLDLYGDNLISFLVPADQVPANVRAAVDNSGAIIADGGTVTLTASVVESVVENVINTDGMVRARAVTKDEQGRVVFFAPGEGTVNIGGTVDVSGRETGQTGGTVEAVGGRTVVAVDTVIDAAGDAGGGTVHIGGRFQGEAIASDDRTATAHTTEVRDGAEIDASAVIDGDGGEVVVWADGATDFAGHISATGGAVGGNGGFVEVSGKVTLGYRGLADLRAANGTVGNLLLDPTDITISTAATSNLAGAPNYTANPTTAATANLNITDLLTQLALGAVTVDTTSTGAGSGDITVSDDISYSGVASALTLNADNDIVLASSKSITMSAGSSLTLNATNAVTMLAGSTISGGTSRTIMAGGAITVNQVIGAGTTTITSTGGAVTVNDGALVNGGGGLSISGDAVTVGTATGTGTTLSGGGGDVDITANLGGVQFLKDAVVTTTAGDVTVQATGAVTLDAGGSGTFAASTTGDISLLADSDNAGGEILTVGMTVGSASAGNVTLEGADFSIQNTVTGSGALTAAPSAGNTLGVGTATGFNADIDTTELGYLSNGFSSMQLGDASSGAATVAGASFQTNVSIFADGQISLGTGNAFNGNDLTVDNSGSAVGFVFVQDALAHTGAGAATWSLKAGHVINLAAGKSIEATGGGTLDLTMQAGIASALGTIDLGAGSAIKSNGGGVTLDSPSSFFMDSTASIETGAGNLTITADGASTLGALTTTTGDITATVGSGGSLTVADGTVIQTAGGDITLDGDNQLTLGDPGSGAGTEVKSNGGTLTLGSASGSVLIETDVVIESGAGDLNVAAAQNLTLNDAGGGGSLNQTGSGNITLEAGNPGTLTVGLNVGNAATGDVTLKGNSLSTSRPVVGSGTLTITPSSAGKSIGVGTGAGDLTLNNATLATFNTGFADTVIGDTSSGNIDIQGATLQTDTTFLTDGDIDVNAGNDFGSNDVTLDASNSAGAVNFNAALTSTSATDTTLDVKAGTSVTMAAAASVQATGAGKMDVTIDAGNGTTPVNDFFYMIGGSQIDTNGGDVTVTATNKVNMEAGSGITAGAGGVSITADGAVNPSLIADIATTTGAINVSTGNDQDLTVRDGSTLSSTTGGTTLTAAGTLSVGTNGGTGATISSTGGSVTLQATSALGGDVLIEDFSNITAGTGAITVNAQDDVSLDNNASVGVAGSGSISLNADINQDNDGTLLLAGPLGNAATGSVTLTGADLDLTGTVTGAGGLTVQPSTDTQAMNIGSAGGFAVSAAELANFTDGFSGITMGRVTTTAATTVNGTFTDPVQFYGNPVTVNGITNTGGWVGINGPIDLNGDITTTNQDVILNGPVTLVAAAPTISTGAGAGNFTNNSTIDGASNLTIDTGTGDAMLNGAIGQTTALNSLSVNANNITVGEAHTTGAQSYILSGTFSDVAPQILDGNPVTVNGVAYVPTEIVDPAEEAQNAAGEEANDQIPEVGGLPVGGGLIDTLPDLDVGDGAGGGAAGGGGVAVGDGGVVGGGDGALLGQALANFDSPFLADLDQWNPQYTPESSQLVSAAVGKDGETSRLVNDIIGLLGDAGAEGGRKIPRGPRGGRTHDVIDGLVVYRPATDRPSDDEDIEGIGAGLPRVSVFGSLEGW